jgi:hypothetical protein
MRRTSSIARKGGGMSDRSGTEIRQRIDILPVRLSEAERAILEARVEKTGYSRAALARYGLCETPLPSRAVPRPTVDHAAVALLLGELGKIGGNINQAQKHINAGHPQWHVWEEAARTLIEMRTLCMKALGREPKSGPPPADNSEL